jgi:LacI family transcriptional regulator
MSPETVRKILDTAEALNYHPSSVARALKTSRTFAVGVAVPDLANPVFPPVVRGLEEILSGAGYTLILSNADTDILKERAVVRAMVARQVDGIVLLTSHIKDPVVEELRAYGIPLVLIGRVVVDDSVPAVICDDTAGIAAAVDHLVRLGHRRMAFIGGPQSVSTGRRRYEGFVKGHQAAGINPVATLVGFAEGFDDVSGAKACRKILEWGEDFSAMIASSDGIALGCSDVLYERGLEIPRDVSLVGFGGTRMSKHFRPTLTTVEVPYLQMGRAGGRLLLAEIAAAAGPRRIVFEPILRLGDSTRSL